MKRTMKYETRVDRNGLVRKLAVRDGVREFYDGELLTAERMNDVLRLTWKATRLLWFGIMLTVLDIIVVLVSRCA